MFPNACVYLVFVHGREGGRLYQGPRVVEFCTCSEDVSEDRLSIGAKNSEIRMRTWFTLCGAGLLVYCFTHGLPTTKVGSWMPGVLKPTCGNEACARLQEDVWPEVFKIGGTPWPIRQKMECQKCQEERKRRCVVLPPGSVDVSLPWMQTFAKAAYVHPYNQPKSE